MMAYHLDEFWNEKNALYFSDNTSLGMNSFAKAKNIFSSAAPNLKPATTVVPRKFCLYIGYSSVEHYALRLMCISLELV